MAEAGLMQKLWLKRLFWRLPGFPMIYGSSELRPDPETVAPGTRPGHYRALNDDPRFWLRSARLLAGGWYVLEVRIQSSQAPSQSKTYVDYGEGVTEQQAFDLSLYPGFTAKRFLKLTARPLSLRFDPMECAGEFRVLHFRLRRVTYSFARPRLLKRLQAWHPSYASMPQPRLVDILREEARGQGLSFAAWLLQRYEDTFQPTPGAGRGNYTAWVRRQTSRIETLLNRPMDEVFTDAGSPRFSIIVPVYNPDPAGLRACLDSVLRQVYPHWQLCLVNDASTDPATGRILDEYAAQDARLDVLHRSENGHICHASNDALALAGGDYVALLDHDDQLAPHALWSVAGALAGNPGLQLVYSDEDKLTPDGDRVSPHFKPDWNPDLLLSQNYITHLTVLRLDLVRRIGGFRPGLEGSQDHDLLLRCLPWLNRDTVHHIPDVLYHWRMSEGSTAASASGKDYTHKAGLRAVQDALAAADRESPRHPKAAAGRTDVLAGPQALDGPLPNTYRVVWPLPQPAPLASLLVPTRDGLEILRPCVDAILERTDYSNFELLILDNGSVQSDTLAYFDDVQARDQRVRVLRWDHAFNFSAINNFGAGQARGELLALVNNDIEPINRGWLTEMVRHAVRPDIGCVGAKLYYPNDTLQHAGVILGIGGVAGHSHKYFPRAEPGYHSRLKLVQNVSAVTAACLVVRKSLYHDLNGLEDQHLAIAFNDVDFCLRVRDAGYRNLWTPYAELYHHESVSRGQEDTPEKVARFNREADYMKQRWGRALARDPAYNPNLTLMHEDFGLAGP